MRKGPKFDKDKCLKCKWHGVGIGWPVKVKTSNGRETTISIHCNWSSHNGSACLKAASNNTAIDIRGEDYHNCLLFKEGEMEDDGDDNYGNILRERI